MLKPTKDWVVTKPVPQKENVSPSGLILLTPPVETTKLVEIVSFGPDAPRDSSLKAGDIVMVPTKTGIKTLHKDTLYEMNKEQNFLGVIEEPKVPVYELGGPETYLQHTIDRSNNER